jgi:hypothetical protein
MTITAAILATCLTISNTVVFGINRGELSCTETDFRVWDRIADTPPYPQLSDHSYLPIGGESHSQLKLFKWIIH